MSGTTLTNKLSREYTRYKYVRQLLSLERSPKYWEALERLLFQMASGRVKQRQDEVFLDLESSHPYYSHIIELTKWEQMSFKEVNILINRIRKIIKEFLNKKTFCVPNKYGRNSSTLYCGEFSKTLNTERLKTLEEWIPKEQKNNADILILILVIRYECLISRMQWTLPLPFYQYMYTNENMKMELFTSPLLCPLMGLGRDIKYFSLFEDTDRYFGSLGPVTEDKMKTTISKGPISVLSVNWITWKGLKKSIKLALHLASKYSNLVLHTVLPERPSIYEITKYYNKAITSSNLIFYRKLVKDQFYLVNPMLTPEPVKFTWGRELNYYVFGSDKSKKFYRVIPTLTYRREVSDKYKELENRLSGEYKRYKYVAEILSLHSGYEWGNIAERFMNTMANIAQDKDSKSKDEVFVQLSMDNPVYVKLREEIKQKRIPNDNEITHKIHKIVSKYFADSKTTTISKYGHVGNQFYCDDFKATIDPTRQKKLIERLGKIGLAKYWDIFIIIVLLRYESILVRGQNWNIPFKWYNYIYTEYGVRFEGFSSPLNSQLIMAGNDTVFCSLFVDTDGIFGSQGNLFHFDIKKYVADHAQDGKKISIALNPPYIESIMEKMVDLIDSWYQQVPLLRVFTGLPYWKDNSAVHRLENHKHLKFKKVLGTDDYYYENSMNEMVPKIYMTHSYEVYVLANFEKDKSEPDYKETVKQLAPPFKNN